MALVVAALIGVWVSVAFSDPTSATDCGAEHSSDLYCFVSNTPAKASQINSNFEVLADKIATLESMVPGLDGRIAALEAIDHTVIKDVGDYFLQHNQTRTCTGFTESNSACFVRRFDVQSTSDKCQAYLSGSQWYAYSDGLALCNIRCIRW